MSTYEKIASVLLVLLLAVSLALWVNRHPEEGPQGPRDFDESTGQDFKIGPFATVIDEETSGGAEERCSMLQPVLIAALHDIDERLQTQAAALGIAGPWDTFEVNAATLAALCNKHVTITLTDTYRDTLVLEKLPFVRGMPPGGAAGDEGTLVSLTATLRRAGAPMPSGPQATAGILIPDRFLDTATSSTP